MASARGYLDALCDGDYDPYDQEIINDQEFNLNHRTLDDKDTQNTKIGAQCTLNTSQCVNLGGRMIRKASDVDKHTKNVIYALTNDSTNEFYLGKTEQELAKRMNGHNGGIRKAQNSESGAQNVHRCFAAYGGNYTAHPLVKFPEGTSTQDICEMEKQLIHLYKPELNIKHNSNPTYY